MRFRLLGEVQVYAAGRQVTVRGTRQQSLLAVLLIEANRPVLPDQLIERVWGGARQPARPANALQTQVTLLRRALSVVPDVVIGWQSTSGYRLHVDEDLVDMHRFLHLMHQADTGPADQAVATLGSALGLWQGEPFAGLDTPWLASVRTTLTRQRLAARLRHNDLRLQAGQHLSLLPGLTGLAAEHPLDERLAGQLMVALYRSGRASEAAEHFHGVRKLLNTELGTDPAPPLLELFQHILTNHPALRDPSGGTRRSPIPAQLPAGVPAFSGRTNELAAMTHSLTDDAGHVAPRVPVVITGLGGIGKTWLALHWAHLNRKDFPDGQLFVDLRGFDPSREPLSPLTAVRGFLDALGVGPGAMPDDEDGLLALYRSVLDGRRMLIVLDNARDARQLIPLLPGSGTCAVVVTSRDRLIGLIASHGATSVPLGSLDEDDSRELLRRRLTDRRVRAEPDAVAQMIAVCRGLPLALGILAARAAAQPAWDLATFCNDLQQATTGLGAFAGDHPQSNLRAVLSWSVDALTARQATLMGLLGVVAVPDIGLASAAALLACTAPDAAAELRILEDQSLLTKHVAGRWRMHDLVRLHALERVEQGRSALDQEPALLRFIHHHLHIAYAADRLLNPPRESIALAGSPPTDLPFDDRHGAAAWLDAEHASVQNAQQVAAQRGWHTEAWQLAWTLNTLCGLRGFVQLHVEIWQRGLDAARLCGAPETEIAHRHLGHANARAGRHVDAARHLDEALTSARSRGDRLAQAYLHRTLSQICELAGDDRRALLHALRALRMRRSLDQGLPMARELNAAGWYLTQLGRFRLARPCLETALVEARREQDHIVEAATLDSLGCLAHATGDPTEAVDRLRQALALRSGLDSSYSRADTSEHLGDALIALGRVEEARDAWQSALTIFRAQYRGGRADRVQQRLTGRPVTTHEAPPSDGSPIPGAV